MSVNMTYVMTDALLSLGTTSTFQPDPGLTSPRMKDGWGGAAECSMPCATDTQVPVEASDARSCRSRKSRALIASIACVDNETQQLTLYRK